MTEQEKFEAWIRNESKFRSIDKYAETGEYVDPFVSILHQGWQAAIASPEPAKDIDMEALKRSQENASKAWAGVDVEKFLQREPQPMPLEKAEELAHRTASRYTHKSDRSFTAYTFLPHTLEDFVRKIEKHHGIG